MVSVGLRVNPSASHNVRRLTSLARTLSVYGRANAAARIIGGLVASGIDTLYHMAEPAGLVERVGRGAQAVDAGEPTGRGGRR